MSGAARRGEAMSTELRDSPAGCLSDAAIRVLLAEDMHMVRGALVALLSHEPDIEIVAEVERGDLIVPAALRVRPDVAVLDIDLPGMDGLSAAQLLYSRMPRCRVLMLTGLAQPGALRRALAARACGFIAKDAPPARLAESIRRVAAGERVIEAAVAVAALSLADNPLTPREQDVLRLAAEGLPAAAIGEHLYLTPGTVRNYLSRILAKVGARTRIEAIRIADDSGWL